MNEQTELTVIRRKAGAGRAPSEGCGMTPVKAFRLALSKAAEDELQLAARVLGVTERRQGQAPLLEALGEESLLVLLEGPEGLKGAATFDTQLLAAVIESQTTGRVTHVAAKPRPPTRTDSAMCEIILDRILLEFEGHLAADPAAGWAKGFRFGTQIENTRLLGLLLEDIEFRVFSISLDLAGGAKQGELLIALPMASEGAARPGCSAGGSRVWSQVLGKAVHASQAEITAVLHRLDIPLAKASSLAAGDVLELPQSALGRVSLEGADGRVVGTARLGQKRGFRALRMNGLAPAPDMVRLAETGDSSVMAAPVTDALPNMAMDMAMASPMPDIPALGDGPSADALADIAMAPMGDDLLGDLPMAEINIDTAQEDVAAEPVEISMAMPMDLEIG